MKDILSNFLGDNITDVEEKTGGFQSKGYKIFGEKNIYFAREVISNKGGYEYNEDIRRAFDISHKMQKNSGVGNRSFGVLEVEGSLFHIQEFVEGETLELDKLTSEKTEKIASQIAEIHNKGKEEMADFTEDYKSYIYTRSLREVFSHPETVFSVYEGYIVDSEEKLFFQQLIEKMIKRYFRYLEISDPTRTSFLHGDFWQANFLEDKRNNIYFIDFSRTPFGEPGIDIGWFVGNLELNSLFEGYEHLSDYKRVFMQKYMEVTKDKEIHKFLDLPRMFVGFLTLSPVVQQFLKRDEARKNKVKERIESI